jgi:hypothetical protein
MTERNITERRQADWRRFSLGAAGNSFSGFRRFFFVDIVDTVLEFV